MRRRSGPARLSPWEIVASDSVTTGTLLEASVSKNNSYWLKMHYAAGTGADGQCKVSYWNGTSWAAEVGITTSTKTAQAAKVKVVNFMTTPALNYYDNIITFDADFTGDPNGL